MTFIDDLTEQLHLLQDYCDLYDSGKHGHAKSIATRIFVLIELLSSQSGADFVKKDKKLLLSNFHKPLAHHATHGFHPLSMLWVEAEIGSSVASARFSPIFENQSGPHASNLVGISKWESEIVLKSASGKGLSRRRLFYQMRNKDGGSHMKTEPEPDYAAVANPLGLGLSAFGPNGAIEYQPPPHFATMRHMGHEILNSPRLTIDL